MSSRSFAKVRVAGLNIRLFFRACVVAGYLLCIMYVGIAAGEVQSRITGTVNSNQAVSLQGSAFPSARPQNRVGPMSVDTQLTGITIDFKPTIAQKAELDALLKAQQTPGSSWYHKWLSPAEYASEFGLSDNDLSKIERWLQDQGFTIDRVANNHSYITFSGTVSQVNSAFATEMDYYKIADKTHFANATNLSIPSALSGVVESVRNLNDFRPRPHVRFHLSHTGAVRPGFTSSESGSHYLQPGDVATIYDITPAYDAGYTGSGQSIAVVGQSEIDVSDIEHFQSAAGLTEKAPTLVLVPGSGTAAFSSDDEAESDLDLEYAGGIAKGAAIYFVYVGNNQNYSVFDALQYAVDTKIAPIISMSYGACEMELSSDDYSSLESIMEEAASQGQSVIVATGDDGSTDCYGESGLSETKQEDLAVDYPASSAYVTGVGGTEFPAADIASSNTTYWESASGSDVITSAKSYIPEVAWNDDSTCAEYVSDGSSPLCSGGGGVSTLTARPSWQSGVTGIPSGGYRLVPDLSLNASPVNGGYLYCTSDTSAWSEGQQASCSDGFRDSATQDLTVAGGTSFDAPIFAGMLAILNQKENSTGQGLINSTLYQLASDSSAYASVFHDITSGGNQCTAGSQYCSSTGKSEYTTTTGYDEATGLGSVDFYNLLTSWTSGSSASLEATTTSLSAATATPSAGASDTITITVAPQSSSISSTPTGTVAVVVDGTTETSSLALTNGSATYTFSSTTSGSHVIEATYSGDSIFAGSSGSITVDVGGVNGSTSPGTFTVSASNLTVSQGSSGTSTITVTSQNSYSGTASFSLSTTSASLLEYGCYSIPNVTVSADQTATTTLTIYTSENDCSSSSIRKMQRRSFLRASTVSATTSQPNKPGRGPFPVAFACIAGGVLFVRKRRLRALLSCLLVVGALSLPIACGSRSASSSSSSSSTADEVAKGTYTITLDGVDIADSSIASSTTFALTVD
ncbi:MAG TPA: peptidase S53 [Acidobacterium sp.]|uniref:Peptidase, S53 family n=2 Tax=Acidobacteriaceae TaxID=204434 RepID=C1F2E1_ACIC5|nr:peptidase, S53 family [Acidobacterium capsulatum ATCC 51196]HCT61324.1 peptidase S53 [Acidobacterium sp.]